MKQASRKPVRPPDGKETVYAPGNRGRSCGHNGCRGFTSASAGCHKSSSLFSAIQLVCPPHLCTCQSSGRSPEPPVCPDRRASQLNTLPVNIAFVTVRSKKRSTSRYFESSCHDHSARWLAVFPCAGVLRRTGSSLCVVTMLQNLGPRANSETKYLSLHQPVTLLQ